MATAEVLPLPQQDRDAEKYVLGSVLRLNAVMSDVLIIVREEDFYVDAHRRLFAAMVKLWQKGSPIDLVILADVLKESGSIDDIGGYGYLAKLWDTTPTAANAEYYARIVRDKSILRRLNGAGQYIVDVTAKPNAPVDDIVEAAERSIFSIAEQHVTGVVHPLPKVIQEAYDRIDEQAGRGGSQAGIASGLIDLDTQTAGFHDGELTIVAARPSVGKSAFAVNVIRHVALQEELGVFLVSLEMSRVELAMRLICCHGGINGQHIRRGMVSVEDAKAIKRAGGALGQAPVYIDDHAGQSMLRIAANARRLKLRHGIRLVVIDYIQLIEPDDRRVNRQEQIAGISRRLKLLARELNIPVIVLAQLNRQPEGRSDGRPRLSDLRESGSQEQDADCVLLLHKPEDQPEVLDVIIAKQRNGPTGDVSLSFNKAHQRIDNLAYQEPDAWDV